ncbi:MAG: hypothetical protein RI973_1466 [Bacteroidota bacterium]|jgi:hypothetical protein
MKKYLIGFVLSCCLLALVAFRVVGYEQHFATAEVVKVQGFYIFTDSKPVMPFENLGTVEITFVADTQYESIRNHLIKRARKKFPDADGLIMMFDKKGADKCEVIKFKR